MPITEKMLMIPALSIAANKPNVFVATSDLITEIEDVIKPTGEDNKILDGRHDTKFSQKVRNLVSHRKGANTMFTLGFAIYLKAQKGIQITEAGREFINRAA